MDEDFPAGPTCECCNLRVCYWILSIIFLTSQASLIRSRITCKSLLFHCSAEWDYLQEVHLLSRDCEPALSPLVYRVWWLCYEGSIFRPVSASLVMDRPDSSEPTEATHMQLLFFLFLALSLHFVLVQFATEKKACKWPWVLIQGEHHWSY